MIFLVKELGFRKLKTSPKKIALFGGSFNPPHKAHLEVLEWLKEKNKFDEIWILPTFSHPFEKSLISFKHRKKMCELMVQTTGAPVQVCLIEEKLKNSPSYTIDAINALKKKYPLAEFTFVVGSDCRRQLDSWKEIQKLKSKTSFLFIPRPGYEESPFSDISSTTIRRLIGDKKDCSQHLPPLVWDYICQNKLYEA